MRLPVTYLFVPGDRPDRFDKAVDAQPDVVIIDLEDAVMPAAKAAARAHAATFAAAHRSLADRMVVRINDASTPWFADDLAFLRDAKIRGAMLPKAERPDDVAHVRAALGGHQGVLALVETARGVRDVDALAAAPGVARLAFGTLDYCVDLDLSGDVRGLAYAASRMAIASRCAGIPPPIAGVTATIDDEAQLSADLAFARAHGFGAKLCIHPRQLAGVRAAFRPTPAEIDWARRVVAAGGASGAVAVDGRMVDRPVFVRAQAILDRAAE